VDGGRSEGADTPPVSTTKGQWLPPQAYLPQGAPLVDLPAWTYWESSQGIPQWPRAVGPGRSDMGSWVTQATLDDLTAELDAERVYVSVDALAASLQVELAARTGAADYRPWVWIDQAFQSQLTWRIATMQGLREVTVLLDTGASHCFICAHLATSLALPPSGQARGGSCQSPRRRPMARRGSGLQCCCTSASGTRAANPCRYSQWRWTWVQTRSSAGTGYLATICAISSRRGGSAFGQDRQ
jgi:hypothetical protein